MSSASLRPFPAPRPGLDHAAGLDREMAGIDRDMARKQKWVATMLLLLHFAVAGANARL
jgi:hypothetical protein